MPAAKITAHEMPANLTAAGIRDYIRDLIVQQVGWTHVKSYLSSGTEYAVFTVPGLSGYVTLSIASNLNTSFGLADGFDAGTNALTGTTSGGVTFVSAAGQTTGWTLIQHPEIVVLRATYGTTTSGIALYVPPVAQRPAWWQASRPYAAVARTTNSGVPFDWYTRYGAANIQRRGITTSSTAQGGRELCPQLRLSISSTDTALVSSADLATFAGSGVALGDTAVVEAGANEYYVLEGGSEPVCVRSV